MNQRIKLLQEKIRNKKLDALLVSNFYNILYLSGFSGVDPGHREAFLLITHKNVYLLTNALYIEEAKQMSAVGSWQFTVVELNQEHKLASRILEIAQKEKLKVIGFEQFDLTYAEVNKLVNSLKAVILAKAGIYMNTGSRVLLRKASKPGMTMIPTQNLIEDFRMIKDESEIAKIKAACKLTDQTFYFIIKKLKVGVTEKHIAWEIEKYIRENGGQLAFSPIVAFGANSSMPHYKLTNNVQLTTHNVILLDFGARFDGYCADMSRVVFMGTPTKKQREMYESVLKTQQTVLASFARPGLTKLSGQTFNQMARDSITKDGFPPYPHSLGHGVGLEIHEGFRLSYKKDFVLKPGMVFSIEPGIYIPGTGGVRIEDLVLLKENGIEILTKSSKKMLIL